MDVPTERHGLSCTSCDVVGMRSAVPWGRRPDARSVAVAASGGSAVRHRRDSANIRLCDWPVNLVWVIDTLTTIAQLPETCRAEVSSLPEGPAGGGSKRSEEHWRRRARRQHRERDGATRRSGTPRARVSA